MHPHFARGRQGWGHWADWAHGAGPAEDANWEDGEVSRVLALSRVLKRSPPLREESASVRRAQPRAGHGAVLRGSKAFSLKRKRGQQCGSCGSWHPCMHFAESLSRLSRAGEVKYSRAVSRYPCKNQADPACAPLTVLPRQIKRERVGLVRFLICLADVCPCWVWMSLGRYHYWTALGSLSCLR